MPAWLLLMVLIAPPGGFDSSYLLNTFNTFEECQGERNRIGFEMAEAYPHEADFRIECKEKRASETPISFDVEDTKQFDPLIEAFGNKLYPGQSLTIRLLTIKTIQTEGGKLPALAIQISVWHNDGGEMYILFVKDGKVIAWIDAGAAAEEEDDIEELFPGKEFA